MHVPPIAFLRSFLEASRQGSFSRAAETLNLTQSAVSQQLRQLEQMVGAPLFNRTGRKVVLTEVGRVYLQSIEGPLNRLEEAHAAVHSMVRRSTIIVRVPRSFGAHWLAPRIPDFARRFPDIPVTTMFLAPRESVDINSGDVVILAPSADQRGISSTEFIIEPLVSGAISPVAGRDFGPIAIAEIASFPIIHTRRRHGDWQAWCRAAGIPAVEYDKGWSFESSIMSYAAAARGLGVVMAELALVTEELGEGRLKRLSDVVAYSDRHYKIAYNRNHFGRPTVQSFRTWITDQIKTGA